ncbi:MAG: hypothetical protein QM737_10235 [Ferruginibacter sp.]
MKISNKRELDEAIIALEKKKVLQANLIREQYQQTIESITPANIIKSAFSGIMHSPEAKEGILKTAAGIGLGLLTKNLFWGRSSSLLKRFLGNAMRVGVAKTAISNSDKIKAYGIAIYNNLFRKKVDKTE